jgi:hypothetical protein
MPLGISQLLRAYPIRSRRGLWGGKQVLNGHKISEFGNKYVVHDASTVPPS